MEPKILRDPPYVRIKDLGEGAYGKVSLVRSREGGDLFCIK